MQSRFALKSSDIDLWSIDLLDTHLDLLDTDIPSKYFVSLHSVFKTSSRYVFKTSSRYAFKTSSRHVFKTFSRNVFKTSSRVVARSLQDVLEDLKLLRWRRVEDVVKTCLEDVYKTSSKPTNVCREKTCSILRSIYVVLTLAEKRRPSNHYIWEVYLYKTNLIENPSYTWRWILETESEILVHRYF